MNRHTTSIPSPQLNLDRRTFLGGSLASCFAWSVSAAAEEPVDKLNICAFIKYVQSLSYEEMSQRVAEIGFDGIESTVRKRGHVSPERVEEDLPRQYAAVKRAGMDITIATTDVLHLDQPLTKTVLKTIASLGIKKYRMGFYKYDRKRSVLAQLEEMRPRFKELAAYNRELGITAVYQNHSGSNYVGAPLWDIHYLLKDIPTQEIGNAFDLRHAAVEGGLSWPLQYNVIKPHIGALFVKDFVWSGERPKNVPLGKGRVDMEFYSQYLKSGLDVPISLHVEYLPQGNAEENLKALENDYSILMKALRGG